MRKNINKMPVVFPMPVLMIAAYDENGTVCAMNAAWGLVSGRDTVALFIDKDHKTTKNIYTSKAFTVALADEEHMAEADFFGIATGNKMPDKFERTGFHAVKSEFVNAPVIAECPVAMECEFVEEINTEFTHAIIGKVVNVSADEKVLGEDGRVVPEKVKALIFDQFRAGYYSVGEKVGQAWNAGKALIEK